ncbi:MAG: hypothetical protein K8G79_12295, partial [bacterium]|nr:hypothetical protein [Candidatus Methylomirabilis sp.]
IRKLLADAHTRVEQTLASRRGELDALAKLLLEKEVVDREALTQLLASKRVSECENSDSESGCDVGWFEIRIGLSCSALCWRRVSTRRQRLALS